MGIAGLRRHPVLHPNAVHGLVHHAGVDALHPMIAPAHHLLQPADFGLHGHILRERMRPRPDQTQPWPRQARQQARHSFGIIVGPPADGINRNGDGRVILADRALLPIGIAALMLQPIEDPRRIGLHPFNPHILPPRTHHLRVGRQIVAREHGRGPVEVILGQAPAHPVNICGIAVIG